MKLKTLNARSAPIAIAAILALGSTPAFAQNFGQEAAAPPAETAAPTTPVVPPMVMPVDTAPAPAPIPDTPPIDAAPDSAPIDVAPPSPTTITPPAQTTTTPANTASPVIASEPIVQTVPVEAESVEEPAPAPVADSPVAAPASAPTAAAPVAAPAPVSPAPDVADIAPADAGPASAEATPGFESLAAPVPLETAPAAESAQSGADWTSVLPYILAGLLPLLALMGGAFWLNRRSHKRKLARVEKIERPRVAPAKPEQREVATADTHDAGEVLSRAAVVVSPNGAVMAPASRQTERDTVVSLKAQIMDSGRVRLPMSKPETREGRRDLIERLAAQAPDRANPFISRRKRIRRARLIVQSLDRKFVERAPRIDLSQYTERWPHLGQPARKAA